MEMFAEKTEPNESLTRCSPRTRGGAGTACHTHGEETLLIRQWSQSGLQRVALVLSLNSSPDAWGRWRVAHT